MCESDEFFPNYERRFYVDTRLASRATASSMHLLDGVLHTTTLLRKNLVSAGSEFGIGVSTSHGLVVRQPSFENAFAGYSRSVPGAQLPFWF